jgi:hypothetical protein
MRCDATRLLYNTEVTLISNTNTNHHSNSKVTKLEQEMLIKVKYMEVPPAINPELICYLLRHSREQHNYKSRSDQIRPRKKSCVPPINLVIFSYPYIGQLTYIVSILIVKSLS